MLLAATVSDDEEEDVEDEVNHNTILAENEREHKK